MKRKTAVIPAAAAVALLALVLWDQHIDAPSVAEHGKPKRAADQKPHVDIPFPSVDLEDPELEIEEERSEVDEPPNDERLIDLLREKFGNGIRFKHTQVKAIEKLLEYLTRAYPDDWRDRVYDFLKRAFPELADELFERFQQMTAYKDWLEQNRHEIMQLSAKDRRDALWDARFQFFGEVAYEIWEIALKNEHILDSLDAIAESRETNIDEKIAVYLDAVGRAYGDRAEQFIRNRQTELMDRFLAVPSVQDDLHALPPEQRKKKLRDLRKRLGLDEEALRRWEDLDAQRDRAWETGQHYMREREQILQQYAGPELEKRLDDLRTQIFGKEAEIIRNEEQAGFFRYQHRRVFGHE